MPRVRFRGDSPTCAWLGVAFMQGKWVNIDQLAADVLARFQAHPHFDVEIPQGPPSSKSQPKTRVTSGKAVERQSRAPTHSKV